MPHQCVKCKLSYLDGAKEIFEGCPCGSKAFFFKMPSKSSGDGLFCSSDTNSYDDARDNDDGDNNSKHNSKRSHDRAPDKMDPDETRLEANVTEEGSCTKVDLDGLLCKKDVVYSPESGKYNLDLDAVLSGKRPKF